MTDGQFWAGLLGALAPMLLALFKRFNISKEKKQAIILAALIMLAGATMFVSGDIDPKACANLGLIECAKIVLGYVGAVFGAALVSYKYVYQAFGIDDKIAGK